MDTMLSSEEAARRLGIKVGTLYAYVSRGQLVSHRDPSGRGSLFALADVESMASRSRVGRQTGRLATVTTGVTQLRPELGPFYRGRAATELAGQMSFEDLASFLWQTGSHERWSAPALGECPLEDPIDRLRWALVMCGATDSMRSDRRPIAAMRAARRVIASFVEVVGASPSATSTDSSPVPIAQRLAQRLSGSDTATAAVNASLVLMADHELATSTLAVRLAASVRSDPYDALTAGLVTLAGQLHGGVSQEAHELLVGAEVHGAQHAFNSVLSRHQQLPGFGHMVYSDGDPRFGALMEFIDPLLDDGRRAVFQDVLDLAHERQVPHPNCDLALAALSWGTRMSPAAGRTIFAIARVAGWTAHYLEEMQEPPLRFRARAIYATRQDR